MLRRTTNRDNLVRTVIRDLKILREFNGSLVGKVIAVGVKGFQAAWARIPGAGILGAPVAGGYRDEEDEDS